jgi:hypothetical protein
MEYLIKDVGKVFHVYIFQKRRNDGKREERSLD